MVTADANAVEIRTAQEQDLPALVRIYNHYVVNTHISFEADEHSVDSRRAWFDAFSDTGPFRLFVADIDDRLAGYASSSRFHPRAGYDPSVETTIYLDPAFVGHGVGRRLYSHLLDSLQSERSVHRAYGGIALPNPSSIALHEKLGFRLVGTLNEASFKFGNYWDVSWYEKRLDGPDADRR